VRQPNGAREAVQRSETIHSLSVRAVVCLSQSRSTRFFAYRADIALASCKTLETHTQPKKQSRKDVCNSELYQHSPTRPYCTSRARLRAIIRCHGYSHGLLAIPAVMGYSDGAEKRAKLTKPANGSIDSFGPR